MDRIVLLALTMCMFMGCKTSRPRPLDNARKDYLQATLIESPQRISEMTQAVILYQRGTGVLPTSLEKLTQFLTTKAKDQRPPFDASYYRNATFIKKGSNEKMLDLAYEHAFQETGFKDSVTEAVKISIDFSNGDLPKISVNKKDVTP